jgi:hypothetical protein
MEKAEYLKSNTWKPEYAQDPEAILDKKGFLLCHKNNLFYKHRVNKLTINWRCVKSKDTNTKCSATCSVDIHDQVVKCGEHNHQELDTLEIEVSKFKSAVKERAKIEDTAPTAIFNQEREKLIVKTQSEISALSKFIPTFSRMRSTISKQKMKQRPKLPTSLKDIKIEGDWRLTLNKLQQFLIYQSASNNILVFCSRDGLKCLAEHVNWHGDGTFYTAAKYFYQLYVIQAWKDGWMIPCVWALMHRRRVRDYEIVCKVLKREAQKNGFTLQPKFCMFDFEIGAISAFRNMFPSMKPIGCLFHFGQNLMRRLGNLGLKTEYSNNEDFCKWIKRIFGLALLPFDQVDDQWTKILNDKPEMPNVDKFLDYFVGTYFEGSFPIELWNHFETKGPRTNNHLEGYNLRLKKCVGTAHPDVFKAIRILQNEEAGSSINYYKSQNGERAPYRRNKEIEKDGKINTLKAMYLDGDITLEVYFKRVTQVLYIRTEKNVAEEDSSSASEDDVFEDADSESDSESDTEDAMETDSTTNESSMTSLVSYASSVSRQEVEMVTDAEMVTEVTTVTETLRCYCVSACKTSRCACKAANIKCNALCHKSNRICTNK